MRRRALRCVLHACRARRAVVTVVGDAVVTVGDVAACSAARAPQAINDVCARYGALGKTVVLRHLSADCAALLRTLNGGRAAAPYQVFEVDPQSDPAYRVAVDHVRSPR